MPKKRSRDMSDYTLNEETHVNNTNSAQKCEPIKSLNMAPVSNLFNKLLIIFD